MPSSTDNTQAQLPTAVIGYPSKLLGRADVAKGTMAFQWEKPPNFAFRAGQSIDLSLVGLAQDSLHRLTHTFSIASHPSDQEIMIPTRIRDTTSNQRMPH